MVWLLSTGQLEMENMPFANHDSTDDNCHRIVALVCSSKAVNARKHVAKAVTTIRSECVCYRRLVAYRFTIRLQ